MRRRACADWPCLFWDPIRSPSRIRVYRSNRCRANVRTPKRAVRCNRLSSLPSPILNIRRPSSSVSVEIIEWSSKYRCDVDLQKCLPRRVNLFYISDVHCAYPLLGGAKYSGELGFVMSAAREPALVYVASTLPDSCRAIRKAKVAVKCVPLCWQ